MGKFGLTVFYLFGLPVNFSAFQFSYFLAFRIRPSVPVRYIVIVIPTQYVKAYIVKRQVIYVNPPTMFQVIQALLIRFVPNTLL